MFFGPRGLVLASSAVATTWNPADKQTNLALSNGNLTTSGVSNPFTDFINVRSTTSKTSGKWYYEINCPNINGGNLFGVANASSSLVGNNNGDGTCWRASSNATGTYGVAVDATARKLWIAKANNYSAGLAGGVFDGNPAAGTGGKDISDVTGALFAMIGPYGANPADDATSNFGASTGAYSPPSGFSWWG